MPWSLEIHHLDIQSVGDATLVIARNAAHVPNIKVALIDGGKTQAGAIIQAYCNTIGVAAIDVVAVTHFDKDHFYGVTWLLENTNLCDNAIIYDLGELPDERTYTMKKSQGGSKSIRVDSDYRQYLDAIAAKPGVRHATKLINSSSIVTYDVNHAATIPHPGLGGRNLPYWLIDKEIMWGDGMDGLGGRAPFQSNPPVGAPTITCIAANKYVRQNGGGVRFVSEVNIFNGPNRMSAGRIADEENRNENAKSLGFLVTFNNFRYYVAGDLESAQEDGHNNVNTLVPVFQPGVMAYVNNANDTAGRVLAMKTSHHGASTASSRVFISQMRPSAAFISTGASNQFNHPAQPVINVLDGYPAVPILGDNNNRDRHPPQPPIPPVRQVSKYYLTGYQSLFPLQTYGGDFAETAGVPLRITPGHIRLEVSAAQSQRAVHGQTHRGILAAATQTAATANLVGVVAANIAEKGASIGTAAAVAEAVGALAAVATAALTAAAWAGNDANGVGVVSAAFAAIGGGAGAATAAAANVAAGARVNAIGAGAAAAIGEAVTGGNAAAITLAAQNAGASANAANAAGYAAETVRAVMNPDDAGFAAAAAIAAVNQGATVARATAIAAAIAATLDAGAATAGVTATMTTNAAIAAGMANGLAALAGAVAGASWWLGIPNEVATATTSALNAAGFNAGAVGAGNAAQLAATIAANDLFNVHFVYDDVINNVNANANIPHSN